jgi:primosomal protein N' (replication factor Y)
MACGFVMHCKHCDIALVFHAAEGRLRCHYCDFRVAPPEACPSCAADENALLGAGTERLEEEVRALLPDARVARLDRDSAARRGSVEKVLDGLRERTLDVVLGTQMLAKGHDFPGVRLVGVVNADLGLQFPDFRAAERTFQLLTQVAGRAGRGGAPGRVIIQTWLPDHYAVRPVVDHAYERFYAEEIAHRAALGYPPCGQLAHVLVSGTDADAARRAAEQLALAARRSDAPEVLGPVPAPLARLRRRHRFQLLVKGPDAAAVRETARRVLAAAARLPRELRVGVDLDPFDML